jgi:hypothetical protein
MVLEGDSFQVYTFRSCRPFEPIDVKQMAIASKGNYDEERQPDPSLELSQSISS